MVQFKIKDIESLEAIVTAFKKNGYFCNSFIHWGKSGIDHFSVQIDTGEELNQIAASTARAIEAIGRQSHGGCENG